MLVLTRQASVAVVQQAPRVRAGVSPQPLLAGSCSKEGGPMSEPTRVGELVPGVLAEVVDRAGHGYQRWAELVAQAGYCHHPIRLAGRVEHADRTTGEIRTVYDS